MSRKIGFCVAVCLILTSVQAARRSLNSITDLIDCPLSGHTNILELLHWFAHEVDVDHHYIRLTFYPTSDYGSHHYGNFENLLDQLPQGYRYYTIGNLYEDESESLPLYVRDPDRRNIDNNKARIIIRVNEGRVGPQPQQIIDQVYITQHPGEGTNYDPDHTYRITPSLLQAVRQRDINEIQEFAMRSQGGNASTRPQRPPIQFAQQARYNPNMNNEGDFLKKVCFAILLIIIIFVLSSIGLVNNRK